MRTLYRYCKERDKWVPAHELSSVSDAPRRGPQVVMDSMNPTKHPIDGKIYDSKSKFREVTRAHGCIEVGNDSFPRHPGIPEVPGVREEIARNFETLSRR